jgi:lysophospholipase L1-like esterase
MINFSGSIKKISNAGLRQSLVFVGDSITWGAYLQKPTYNYTYLIQKYINDKYGYTGPSWGGGFIGGVGYDPNGQEICARNVTMDDVNDQPYPVTAGAQFSDGVLLGYDRLNEGPVFDATFGMYPFSCSTGISGRPGTDGWETGAITLGIGGGPEYKQGRIYFYGKYRGNSQGYLTLGLMGAGEFQVQMFGGGTIGTYYTGHKFTARATQGSATLDQIAPINGDWYAGNSLVGSTLYADGNALSSPFRDTATTIIGTTGNGVTTITMNTASPVSGNYTFWALEGITRKLVVGPFNVNQSESNLFFIRATEFVPVITMIELHSPYPSAYTTVQTHGRNAYRLLDYSSVADYPFTGNADVAAKQIMATVIHNEEDITAGTASRPIYVLNVGINDIPSSSVADYKANLKRLASAFKNTNYRNYGRVVLTVPMNPVGGRTNFYLYRKAVIDAAKELGCGYVDLARLTLTGYDYVADGLHPNIQGYEKIAKYYINMLGL